MTTKIVKSIKSNKWTESSDYPKAHRVASKKEKAKYPKQYNKLNKWIEKNTKNHEYVGMNDMNGKIEEEKKLPKKFRAEVHYHEETELKKRKQLKRK